MRKLIAAFLMLVFATVHVAANAYAADALGGEQPAVTFVADYAMDAAYPVDDALTSGCCGESEAVSAAGGTHCSSDCVLGLVDVRVVLVPGRASPVFSLVERRMPETSSGLHRPPIRA